MSRNNWVASSAVRDAGYAQRVRPGGACVSCGASTGPKDFCYGCKSYVCAKCDAREVPPGAHDPAAHRDPREAKGCRSARR